MQHGVVGRVHADEGAEALDFGVLEDRARRRPLQLRHALEGHVLRGFDAGLELARVLGREEAFRDRQVEQHRKPQGRERDDEGDRLVRQHGSQQAVVAAHDAVE